jgi:hypothetical protein
MRVFVKIVRVLIVAGLVGYGVWWLVKRGPQPASKSPEDSVKVTPTISGSSTSGVPSNSLSPSPAPAKAPDQSGASPLDATSGGVPSTPSQPSKNPANYVLGSPSVLPTNMSPQSVLENARRAIVNYGSTFDGNPVGTNPEITSALNGENPKQIKFLNTDDGMRINGAGELVDAWGTPFFFHQLSGKETEIRSAGPDRRMWTGDDLLIK